MPNTTTKEKKAPRAAETTPKVVTPFAKNTSPKKTQAPATATAPSAKPARRTRASMPKEVRLPGPYVEPAPASPTRTHPTPDLITGDEDSTAGSPAPHATKPSEGEPATANTTTSEPAPAEEASIPSPEVSSNARKVEDVLKSSDSRDPTSSANTTPPARAPPERSPPPDDGPDPVGYEESEPDQDREQGEAPDPNSSPQLTEQQRVTHPGSPATRKTAAAVARVEAQARRESALTRQTNEREFEDWLRFLGYTSWLRYIGSIGWLSGVFAFAWRRWSLMANGNPGASVGTCPPRLSSSKL
ncbi:unnamed protein product [Phytophthora fragariaefolia]|uniref:Unnamed protein product n=1 Tax=Phytophthora fragariaefolia TaxID=1490495 RepID=A0A9W6Y7B0_9STRA|nr:unnamed protein product [Phytophthora fragariaefolia]